MAEDEIPDPWPLRHLVLRTPRLELRPDDDAGLAELVDEIHLGIHPPDQMPFGVSWTDAPRELLGRNAFQHHWSVRAALCPESWSINFLVRRNGVVIGTQGLHGKDFAITREVGSGSWIGMRHQGNGYGTEMRAAVLQFAFDHLDAVQALSAAWIDNAASRRVSAKLGYVENGRVRQARRGEAVTHVRLLLTRESFAQHRPPWSVEVSNLAACLPLLGVSPG